MICRACGDEVKDWYRPLWLRESRGVEPDREELLYCLECASELFRGEIRFGCVKLRVGRPEPCRWLRDG